MLLNALDFVSVQAALDSAVAGDRVYLPGVKVYEAPAGGWRVERGIEIYGDGPGNPTNYQGTVLTPSSVAPGGGVYNDVFVLEPPGRSSESQGPPDPTSVLTGVFIHDLRITRRAGQTGADGRDGIRFRGEAPPAQPGGPDRVKLVGFRLERVAISFMGGVGLRLEGRDGSNGSIVGAYVLECDIASCGDVGARLKFSYQTFIARSRFAANAQEGLIATDYSEPVLHACCFDANRTQGGQADLVINHCLLATVEACQFSNFGGGVARRACLMDNCGGAGIVSACVFELPSSVPDSIALELGTLDNGAVLVLPNRSVRAATALKVPNEVRDCVIFPQFCDPTAAAISLPAGVFDAPVAFPSVNLPGANSAAGLLVPSLAANPDSNVQGGMLAYVGGQLKVYRGEAAGWKSVVVERPALITDVVVPSPTGKTTMVVHWTAPGDPSSGGPVAAYDIRYSLSPITEANFSSASPGPEITPSDPGTVECAGLVDLNPSTRYYVAIKSCRQSGGWTPISNVASGVTQSSGSEVACP